jgi:hypothetical protein
MNIVILLDNFELKTPRAESKVLNGLHGGNGIADVCLDPHRGYTFSKAYANPKQWSMASTFEGAPLWAVAAPGI